MTDQQKSILIKQAFALIEEAYGEPALKMEITFRSECSAIVAAAQTKHEESFRRAEATTAVPGGDASTAQCQDASHQPKREEGLREALIEHEPIAYRDHSDAWIQCTCGWGGFGDSGEDWREHFLAALAASPASREAENG